VFIHASHRGDLVIKTAKPDRDHLVKVTFVLPVDQPAGPVSVVGDFNDWDPFAHPLRKRTNGTRSATVKMPVGSRLHFRYLAEGGVWFDDDAAELDGSGTVFSIPAPRRPI
jgi:1,4-alpha-glucan branching enzyme